MSTASKVTFGCTCLFAVSSFVFVNYSQKVERDQLRQGPIKDALRIQEKKQREMSKKQLTNDLEHKDQKVLKEKYEKIQPLNSEIIRGEEK